MNVLDLNKLSNDELIDLFNNDEKIKKLLKDNVSVHRYEHSLGVAKLASELAIYHGVDKNKAYKAALLHDLYKNIDEKISKDIISKYEPAKLKYPSSIYHGYIAYYLLKELNVIDDDILEAIYNHTILEKINKLNLILFISDKREEGRNINDDIVTIAKEDLLEAYHKLVIDIEEYISGRKEKAIRINN